MNILVIISVEDDNGQFAHEEHQLILSEDEQLIGLCFVYTGEPMEENILTFS
jgi:hypothetical protein